VAPVIDHFGINCKDYPRSQQFYDRVLGTLGYFAAFVRDPDGNNVEAVCHA
jgi:catechol 2,3-dioxygenase-like lactoylglutathione lyase family enzyme